MTTSFAARLFGHERESALRAAVIGGPDGPAAQVAQGLRAAGAEVVVLPAGGRAELARAADRGRPPAELVVWAPAPGAAAAPTPLLDYDEAGWDRRCRAADSRRDRLRASRRRRFRGGRRDRHRPADALAAAARPDSPAWSTAAEGVRSLVKVAAREFGHARHHRQRRCPAGRMCSPARRTRSIAPGFRPPACPFRQARVATYRRSSRRSRHRRGQSVTGATIAVDGGVWMPA